MKNGDHPVSNSCLSLLIASKKLLMTVHTFFPFFDCDVSTSFRNPVWTIEIRRTTCLYVQNIKATVCIHQMRHTIIRDYLLKNIVITLQSAMMYQFQKYLKKMQGCRNSKKSYQGISMVVTVVQHVHQWHVLTTMLRSLIVDIVILKISTKCDQMIFLLIS